MIRNCRKCGVKIGIISFFEKDKSSYPNGVICFECWSAPAKTTVKVYNHSANHRDYSTESDSKFETGDSVFVRTEKYGIILVQIIDCEIWPNNVFYTLDIKGKIVDYVDEADLYASHFEANQSSTDLLI